MFRPSGKRIRGLSFNRLIPNILTMLALCAGLTAMRYGLEERWEAAVISLVVAAILDALDGRLARLLEGTSKFGAELDSLSDFICFGVAPALLLFLWTMNSVGPFGWVLVLLFSVCCALRLARFNTNLEEPKLPAWAKNYFIGVPAPAGAGLVLLPMVASFQHGGEVWRSPVFVSVFIVVVACLLVSKIPTYSFKNVRVQHRFVLATMLLVGFMAAMIVSAPWQTLTAMLFVYIATIPFSMRTFHSQSRKATQLQTGISKSGSPAE